MDNRQIGNNILRVKGEWTFTVYRANGKIEKMGPLNNLVPDSGSVQFAQKLLDEQTSRSAYIAVGTVNTVEAMANTTLTGEVDRKIMSLNATSANVMVQACTFGGAADTLTGVVLQEAGAFNHASSGQGQMTNRIVFASSYVTLAASDLLKVEIATTIGSHS